MAIQFACPACQQPIEVDDEWASQTVSCPYCRRIVRAPAESTLQFSTVPAASQPSARTPSGAADTFPPPSAPPIGRTAAAPNLRLPGELAPNPLGKASVVFGVVAWTAMIAGMAILMPIMWDIMTDVQSAAATRPADERSSSQQQQELNQRLQTRFEEIVVRDVAVQKRVAVSMLLILAAEACGLVGVILALIGVTRPDAARGAAVAGVVINAVFLSAQCGMLAFGLLAGA